MPLPLVLAGPILRRVEPNLVSVWLALSEQASIAITVWERRTKAGTADPLVRSDPPASTMRFGYHAGVIPMPVPAAGITAQRYDARTLPLEALVERQRLRTGSDPRASLRLAVESGLHFLRMLEAQATSRSYRADFIQRFVLQPPTDAERAAVDRETLAYWNLMAGRAPDARRLSAAFRAADGRRLPLPADLGVAAGDRAEVDRAIDEWLAQQADLFAQPDSAEDAWNPERIEYAFSVGAAFGQEEIDLTAAEYSEGHLDWHSVDIDTKLNLGASQDNAAVSVVRATIPPPVTFRGAPAPRFWEMEDANIDYGLLPAGPSDLPHLMLSEFATSFRNDWYVIPLDLPIGTLTRTRSLVVVDSFGVQTLIAPMNDPAKPATGFSLFELSRLRRDASAPLPAQPNLLFLSPSLHNTLEGRALEEVLFMRDEMANVAWAVERAVQGPLEQRIDRAGALERAADVSDAPAAGLRYRLATNVPENWTPLLPQRVQDGSLRARAGRDARAGWLQRDPPRPGRATECRCPPCAIRRRGSTRRCPGDPRLRAHAMARRPHAAVDGLAQARRTRRGIERAEVR